MLLGIPWLRLHVLLLLELSELGLVVDHLLLDVVLHVGLHLGHVVALKLLLFILLMLLCLEGLKLVKVHLTAHRRLLRLLGSLIGVRLVPVSLSIVAVALLRVLVVGLFHLHGPVLNH